MKNSFNCSFTEIWERIDKSDKYQKQKDADADALFINVVEFKAE